ncbi:MAG: DUF4350 domain-containing protein [Dysgonamonadaceae bacterium]|nr:DUF4350 domain-containing protein [Dysgonamonadaceae bacterium]
MKKSHIYIAFIILLFFLLYWMNLSAPIQYRWKPTFNTGDRHPYGAHAFDKIMKSSWEKGYSHSYQSITNLMENDSCNYNLLIIAEEFYTDEEETNALLDYINRGGNALIAAHYFSEELSDTLNISTLFFLNYLTLDLSKGLTYFPVCLYASGKEKKNYSFPSALNAYYMRNIDDENRQYIDSAFIISETSGDIVSLRYRIGDGNLILACNPLVYTNYGILHDSISEYIGEHLAYLQNRPLIRTEYYHLGSQGGSEQSPFRYILSERSLRWAFYLAIVCLFVFMIFTAKRKQKAIPVIKPPANRTLAFVHSIAGLYILKNNNADIVSKKYAYWADSMRKKHGIDVVNETHDWNFYTRIASKTGRSVEDIRSLLIYLHSIDKNTSLSDSEMMKLITKMNETQ